MEAHEELVRLPCHRFAPPHGSIPEDDGPCGECAADDEDGGGEDEDGGPKAHLFHAECLSRWLLTSAACPTCRRGVRPMLKL